MVLEMNKRKFSTRLSDAAFESLERFSEKWQCESQTEALEKILIRWRYLDDLGFTQQQITEELACILRIQHEGLYYCMFSAPRNVNLSRRLLETLQVCAVCKKRQLGLTESSIAPASLLSPNSSEGQAREPLAQDHAAIRDPTKKHEGMKYCKDVGNWVFPKRCELCRTKTYAQFDQCQKDSKCNVTPVRQGAGTADQDNQMKQS
jgi:hypothetical protein